MAKRSFCLLFTLSILYQTPHSGSTVQSMDTRGQRDFRPFIPECAKVGIGRSKAYELANAGLLETMMIGRRRFVFLDSLYSLPQRLSAGVREAAHVASP